MAQTAWGGGLFFGCFNLIMEAYNQGLIIESWLNPEIFLLHFTLFLTITSDPAYDINEDVYHSIYVFGVWQNIINWPGIHTRRPFVACHTLCPRLGCTCLTPVYLNSSCIMVQQRLKCDTGVIVQQQFKYTGLRHSPSLLFFILASYNKP